MNQSDTGGEALPGLETASTAPVLPAAPPATPARPRVKPVDRSQLTWQMLDVERLIEPEHPARAIWELVGRLKFEGFYAAIEAVEGGRRAYALGSTITGEPMDLCLQPWDQFGARDSSPVHV
jgi:hypothetical protein